MRGAVSFVGAGPGAADLITLRGASRIAEADLVLYTPGTTDPVWLRGQVRVDAELVDHARLDADELAELYRRLASRRHRAVRLVAGDPALSPDLREQRELCGKLGLDVEVVPGISPVSAAAAATGNAVTELGGVDTFVFTEAEFDRVRELAVEGRTVAVHAPAARAAELAEALAGLDPEVPVVVAYKVSRSDEVLLRTTLGELAAEVKAANLWRHALFLVGDAVRESKPRAGYAPRESEPGRRWTSRSWRSAKSGESWSKRGNGSVAVVEAPEPETPEPEADVPEPAPKPAAAAKTTKPAAAAKKQQPRARTTTAKRAPRKS
ncbi:cobalt-precorrin-4/precorrin-4 C(11)-methyltransferase [Actinokineospora auranticolor]|uniref:Precorrin-4/cobalt-precorrin-4 C11-methyltransferase n=1 Tax=Actinokineospora auranticolor TaxID=155976 RepID=A0A2S6GFF8_9PSEU|nr:cobalt-precorrin-4/precorrin-4 C(11)-methyltransferase [Actinokineospora auranticolor]PPK63945.1 precorrin-4/cobalt-precorrin-4 C11-methyltransferase [Actinokineospora auranticolor]